MTFLDTLANTAEVMGQPGFSYASGLSYVFWMNMEVLTIGTLLLPRSGIRFSVLLFAPFVSTSGIVSAIFSGKKDLHRTKMDIIVLSVMRVVLLIIGIAIKTFGDTIFPPLSGPLAFLTDSYFLLTSAIVLGISVYMTFKLVKYIIDEITLD